MSWLTDLATKAEAFLEKVDQTAATSLNTEEQRNAAPIVPPSLSNHEPLSNQQAIYQQETLPNRLSEKGRSGVFPKKEQVEDTNHQLPRTSSVPNMASKMGATTDHKTNTAKKEFEDDPLFEFLNNSAIPSGPPKRHLLPKTSTPIRPQTKTPMATSSLQDPLVDDLKLKSETKGKDSALPGPEEKRVMTPIPFPMDSADLPKVEEKKDTDISPVEIQMPVPMKNIASERLSNLELENKLLKGEMSSLNEELASSIRKAKDLQEDLNRAKAECSHYMEVVELKEKDLKMLQGNEKDYKEAINAKDSQLAVLRIRIQEVDDELKIKSEMLGNLQNENERVLRDHSESTGVQSIALDNIKQKLLEAETNVEKEREAREKTLNELVELRSKLQTDQQDMALTVKQLQAKLSEEKAKVRELDLSTKSSNELASSAQRELKEYREKATRILQAKEKLINSLKQGSSAVDNSPLIVSELEELKQEKEFLRDELQQAKYKLEQFKVDMQDMDHQHQAESDEQTAENDTLRQSLDEEQRRRQQAEEDCQRSLQDSRLLREDLQRHKKYTVEQLQERDKEIKALRNQIVIKSTTSTSQEELENRVRSLTESLIQKQTLVETLSTEKSSLSLQLERLEQQYKDVQQSLMKRPQNLRSGHGGLGEMEDLEEGTRLRSIESIMPTPIVRSRHWKSTVNEIDKFSIRLGLFLRRYPIARLFVILYMFILHLWVTVVLLTYKPEVHSDLPPGAGGSMPHER